MQRLLCSSLILLALLVPTTLQARIPTAPTYDALVVFGDSYCDVGNDYVGSGGFVPGAPYYMGRFSNGPIWLEHVAGYLGLPLKPSLSGGTDYAYGGAWVTAPQTTILGTIPSVPQQVAQYLKAVNGQADPNALYILEGGGNDILGTTTGTATDLGNTIANELAQSELQLRQAGARHFLIPNLFDVSLLPAGQANAAFASAATAALNKALNQQLAQESFLEHISIARVDVFGFLHAVVKDPNHFGFTDVTHACINSQTNTVCADPDHTFFWDQEHPTEFGHAMFAVTVETSLGLEPN